MVADGDISLSPSVNKLLVTALPPGLFHPNILRDVTPVIVYRVNHNFLTTYTIQLL